MNIEFDKHGLITPKEIIELSLADFERIFVKERTEKAHRQAIFEAYLKHNEQIKEEVGAILFQFVNGSFTTLKDKPKDIDVVSFIDYRIYNRRIKQMEHLLDEWEKNKLLDAFFAPRSYPGHLFFIQSQIALDYWKDLFSASKKTPILDRQPKGLIKINFYE